MDALEEVAGGPNQQLQDLSHIVKGKRTKRSRSTPHSPISFTMITATTTPPHSPAGDAAAAAENAATSAPIPTPPTPEDEDMARCLMLLSQGGGGFSRHPPPAIPKSPIHKEEEIGGAWNNSGGAYNNTGGAWNNNGGAYNNNGGAWNNGGGGGSKFCSKKYIETTTGGGGGGGGVKVGMYVYECRTCGRTFPTFQALGGHRTSHTKEKAPLMTAETAAAKRPLALYDEEDVNPYPFNKAPKISPTPFSSLHFYDSAKSSPRIHECSYCGAEFSSGQALGGHMRRHRNSAPAAAASPLSPSSSSLEKRVPQKEENNGKCLNLDLNLLPAGEENQDHRRARELPENQEQQPPPVEPTLFLSTTPPLVGCKYI